MKQRIFLIIALATLSFTFIQDFIDKALREMVVREQLAPIQKPANIDPDKVELGRLLFFDKLLSGNKDISCATCHHPSFNSGDSLVLSIGVGGTGLGGSRQMGKNRHRIPRNSPEIFNRGAKEWHTMFWDGRVALAGNGKLDTPAEEKLPQGLDNVLAAQAMFPVTSRDEMRGRIGDQDVNGQPNKLALISNAAPQSVWKAIMARVLEHEEYRNLFTKVYPDIPLEKLGFQHAANAIAAFEAEAFTFVNSPWDRYLSGQEEAISKSAKRGALLFFGAAQCSSCHSGNLMTDQEFHNIGAPQFGPGKGNGRPYDYGRYAETGQPENRFAFRTPPLRNVALTGPWMHNGAYFTLEEVIGHHLNPTEYLRNYDPSQLEDELQATYHGDEKTVEMILETLDPKLPQSSVLDEGGIADIISFLESLTDSSLLRLDHLVPERVPSGLAVDERSVRRAGY